MKEDETKRWNKSSSSKSHQMRLSFPIIISTPSKYVSNQIYRSEFVRRINKRKLKRSDITSVIGQYLQIKHFGKASTNSLKKRFLQTGFPTPKRVARLPLRSATRKLVGRSTLFTSVFRLLRFDVDKASNVVHNYSYPWYV